MNATKQEYEIRMAREERFEAWRRLIPDSRCQRTTDRQIVATPMGLVQRIYCINCGQSGGAVTYSSELPDVTYICKSCAATHGGLPIPEIPDAELHTRRA
jgi:hypothetical protein